MNMHDCQRHIEVIAYREEEKPTAKSGWFKDRYFRIRRTEAERIQLKDYMDDDVAPLFYVGACEAPKLIKDGTKKLTMTELGFPVIKAITKVTGCDVDEVCVDLKTGRSLPARQRYDRATNKGLSLLLDADEATHSLEAISLLRGGWYVLQDSLDTNKGTIDYKRAEELAEITLIDSPDDWSGICADPMESIESIVTEMAKYGAVAGKIDIICSPVAWKALKLHSQREGMKYHTVPTDIFTQNLMGYSDVSYMGSPDGKFEFWVSNAQYVDYDGEKKLAINDGEIMIVSRDGFDGQRIFRTLTSDNAEMLPKGTNVFLYSDPREVYNKKCRAFEPWMEEYHLMVAKNINGACVVKVVPADFVACVACETCDDTDDTTP